MLRTFIEVFAAFHEHVVHNEDVLGTLSSKKLTETEGRSGKMFASPCSSLLMISRYFNVG